jgi:phosphoribosylformylglycinamidine (FGAM) synthase-like enzyme
VQNAVRGLIQAGLVKSAHDCSEGGIAVTLAECCFNPNEALGAEVDLTPCSRRPLGDARASQSEAATLFGEAQSRIVISVVPADAEKAVQTLRAAGVSAWQIGTVGGTDLLIGADEATYRWPVVHLHDQWWNAIRRALESDSSGDRLPSL